MRIELRPSRQLALLLVLAHATAAGATLVVPLPAWAKLLLVTVIAASLGWSVCGPALLRRADTIVAVEMRQGGTVSFRTRRGDWHNAVLLDTSFVAARLTVLNLQAERSRFARHVVIMPDTLAAEDFRRLRVWLQWRSREPAR